MSWVTAKEFAEMVGCSKPNITQSIKRGRIAPEHHEKIGSRLMINLEALEYWNKHRERQVERLAEKAGRPAPAPMPPRPRPQQTRSTPPPARPHQPPPRPSSEPLQEVPDLGAMLWGAAQAAAAAEPEPNPPPKTRPAQKNPERIETERRIAAVKLELLEMEAAERAGTLISAERVKKDQFEAGKRVRDSMLQIPVRLEHRIGREFAQLLEAEIRDQLTRVALELQEGETE